MIESLAPTYTGESASGLTGLFALDAAVADHTVPSDGPTYPATVSGLASFFANASNAVAAGLISGELNSNGMPVWINGVCWRPTRCMTPDVFDIDCSDCGNPAPAWAAVTGYLAGDRVFATDPDDGIEHNYKAKADHTSGATFDSAERDTNWTDLGPNIYQALTHPDDQGATPFEVVFRDRISPATTPVTAASLRAYFGRAFGQKLWEPITAGIDADTITQPPALVGVCSPAEDVVDELEHATGYAGEGTLLAPTRFLRHLINRDAVIITPRGLRTPTGNRVISEGISVHTAPGDLATTGNIAMAGPVDYAATDIRQDREGSRDRGNLEAMVINVFGIARTDMCAVQRGCANIPTSTGGGGWV